jgi:hypothetical protein
VRVFWSKKKSVPRTRTAGDFARTIRPAAGPAKASKEQQHHHQNIIAVESSSTTRDKKKDE